MRKSDPAARRLRPADGVGVGRFFGQYGALSRSGSLFSVCPSAQEAETAFKGDAGPPSVYRWNGEIWILAEDWRAETGEEALDRLAAALRISEERLRLLRKMAEQPEWPPPDAYEDGTVPLWRWRFHLPAALREAWDTLPLAARVAAIVTTGLLTEPEEWKWTKEPKPAE